MYTIGITIYDIGNNSTYNDYNIHLNERPTINMYYIINRQQIAFYIIK